MFKPQFNILPQGARGGALLPWVVAVMMYLFGLVLFGALAIQGGLSAWTDNLDRSFTVQVLSPSSGAPAPVEDVSAALAAVPGVVDVNALTQKENIALLESWLGEGNVTEDLPIPALIDVTIAAGSGVTGEALASAVAGFPSATVETSARWLQQVERAASALVANAYAILAVVLAATIAVVVFGTRAQLAAHQDTVLIVHHMGADDRVISKEFEYSFLQLGLIGGLIGLGLVILTLLVFGFMIGGQSDGLIGILQGRWTAALYLIPLPLLAGAVTLLTARFTVMRTLALVP